MCQGQGLGLACATRGKGWGTLLQGEPSSAAAQLGPLGDWHLLLWACVLSNLGSGRSHGEDTSGKGRRGAEEQLLGHWAPCVGQDHHWGLEW